MLGLQTFSLDKAAEEGSVQLIDTLLLHGVGVNNVFRKGEPSLKLTRQITIELSGLVCQKHFVSMQVHIKVACNAHNAASAHD